MANENQPQNGEKKKNVTIGTEESFKKELKVEAFKRGHSVSEAGEIMLKLAYRQYLQMYPPTVSLSAGAQ
jgi:hypothetical protein